MLEISKNHDILSVSTSKRTIRKESFMDANRFLNGHIDRRIKKFLMNFAKFTEILLAISRLSDEIAELKKQVKELFGLIAISADQIKILRLKTEKLEKHGSTPEASCQADIKHVTGKAISQFRIDNNLSIKNFAILIGARPPMVSNWEHERIAIHPKAEKVIRSVMNMSTDRLHKKCHEKGIDIKSANSYKKKTPSQKKVPKIITAEQIRQLRQTLGMTQKQMAAEYMTKEGTWRNWEYGKNNPPVDTAKSLLKKYEEVFGVIREEQFKMAVHSQSPEMLLERRKAAGLSRAELAVKIGVSESTIANWENRKTTPSDENAEKLNGILGAVQTESAMAAVQKRKQSNLRRTKSSSGYKYTAQTLRDFRKEHSLSQREMSILMRVPLHRYTAWERKNRGVPPDYNNAFTPLLLVGHEEIIRQLNYWSKRSTK